MSGASSRHKARARQLEKRRAQQKEVEKVQREQSALRKLLSVAGKKNLTSRSKSERSALSKGMVIIPNPNFNPQNRRSRMTTTVRIPPASDIPTLQKRLAIANAKEKVVRATHTVSNINPVPIHLQVGSSRSGRSGSNRRAIADFKAKQNANKKNVTTKFTAQMNLFNAKRNLASLQLGVPVSQITPNTKIGVRKSRTSRRTTPILLGAPPEKPFLIQSSGEKVEHLKKQTGFDIGFQLQKTKERFGVDLKVDDIIANPISGGIVPQAKVLFERNKKIKQIKETRTFAPPDTVELDQNSDFDTLFGRRESIVTQQKQRLAQIEKEKDPDLKIARIEKELPLFNQRAGEIDGLIGNLNTRLTKLQKNRKAQDLLTATGSLQDFKLKTLVDRRNQLTRIRNEKVDIFNQIQDPALRQVTKEQDIPQFDKRIGELDANIDQAVKFGQNRKQINIAIENAPTKRRGRAPKTFDVTVGDAKKTFRRTERGARDAEIFLTDTKRKKTKEIESIIDPINKEVAKEQDLEILGLGVKASKQQRKALKTEKRVELESLNIGGATGTSFLPFTPADTPTGKLSVQAIPKGRGVPKVFDQLNFEDSFGDRQKPRRGSRGGGSRGRINQKEFDIGNLFGNRGVQKVNKRRNAGFDFF
jgi:hypothetical protein